MDFQHLSASTPWVSMPEQYSGQCERANGATWLQLDDVGLEGDSRQVITEPLGPLWGTHLEDVNVALGNLVGLTAIQSRAYLGSLQVTSITPTSGSTLGETAVTITGSGFLAGATVEIGNAATSVDVVSETEITAKTAATAAGADEVVVTDANGTSTGGPSYTYYITPPPTVVTGSVSAERSASATLNATVNPNGEEVSECKFEYGTTASYGKSVPCTPSPGSGSGTVAVSASITGLTPTTAYHYRISATNPGGASKGSDQTFTTQSAAHWKVNGGEIKPGRRVPIISWGTLTLKNAALGTVTCHNVEAGWIQNPVGGGAGISMIESYSSFFECAAPGCPGTISVISERLPWSAELFREGKVIRHATKGIELTTICTVKEAGQLFDLLFSGELAPEAVKGTSAAKPSFDEFGQGSGSLLSGEASGGEISGRLKMMGYEEQEVITVA
jgi:hypothetical protein